MQSSRHDPEPLDFDENSWRQLFLDILPETPEESRFMKEEFVNDSFSVDNFVKRHRKELPLEKLRECLSLYLKRIRLARNDLINQDYADFVNLSTNLVGLNKSINILVHPLLLTRKEVSQVQEDFSQVLRSIEEKMTAVKQVRRNKQHLQRLLETSTTLSKLESIVGQELHTANTSDFILHVERVVIGLRSVKRACLKISSDLPLRKSLIARCNVLISHVIDIFENVLSDAVKQKDKTTVDFVMRIHEMTGEWPVVSPIL